MLCSVSIQLPCPSGDPSSEVLPGVDFGLHPSDAGVVCGGEFDTDLVAVGYKWHPGRLLYYGRAELKQSDHRCVCVCVWVCVGVGVGVHVCVCVCVCVCMYVAPPSHTGLCWLCWK